MTVDCIRINDLALRAVIGVFPEERREKQDLILNLALYADLSAAGKSDDLRDTVDYKAVKKAILALAEDSAFNLIETLAERVAALCLADPRVRRVAVTVDKPGALRFARSASVTLERGQPA